jgi:hypothetical protein
MIWRDPGLADAEKFVPGTSVHKYASLIFFCLYPSDREADRIVGFMIKRRSVGHLLKSILAVFAIAVIALVASQVWDAWSA